MLTYLYKAKILAPVQLDVKTKYAQYIVGACQINILLGLLRDIGSDLFLGSRRLIGEFLKQEMFSISEKVFANYWDKSIFENGTKKINSQLYDGAIVFFTSLQDFYYFCVQSKAFLHVNLTEPGNCLRITQLSLIYQKHRYNMLPIH